MKKRSAGGDARRILSELERRGILLLQDRKVPSLVSILAGEAVKGSWWAHPKAHRIFRCLREVGESPDVLATKLVAGKVTLVHRRLWPALLAAAASREAWQLDGLSKEARRLLRRVETEGSLVASGSGVKELERRLLVVTREEHTESGAHRMVVETWEAWAKAAKVRANLSPLEGRLLLEKAVGAPGAPSSTLPWSL